MARNVGVQVVNNFRSGHITEASGLNFPENACTDTDNCTFDIRGNVVRRSGLDFEYGFVTKTIQREGNVVNTFQWKDVGGDSAINLLVMQIGSTLYFWDVGTGTTTPGGAITANIDLTAFSPSGAPAPNVNECQFATGKGFLFVTHPHLEPFSVQYNSTPQTFTTTQITLEIRDVEGVDDGLAVDNRPTSTLAALSATHHYNLLNQGWTDTQLTAWDSAQTTMPSNADVMWLFRDSSNDLTFSTSAIARVVIGNSPAPKGHYVLNFFSQQRDTVSGLVITDVTSSYQRCATCAFFAGRLFYGGTNAQGFASKILFSQILEGTTSTAQFGKCYQANDPTSEEAFDLLSSDGGVLVIPEMGPLIKLVALPGVLLAFASNGIWSISGSTGLGFTADDYTIQKISTISTISSSSFVEVEGSVFWWNSDAIWLAGQGQGGLSISSITLGKNQSYFNTIPGVCKQKARGAFDPITRVVQWVYSIIESGTITGLYEFDHIMNYNISSQAFYNWSFDVTNPVKIHGSMLIGGRGGIVTESIVVNGVGDTVVDGSGSTVIAYTLGNQIVFPQLKYIVSYADSGSYKFTFAEARDLNYVDWFSSALASNFDSYFISGYRVHADAQKKFQSNYIYVFTNNTELGLSSYYIQGLWNYANTGDSGKWTSRQIEQATDINYDNSIRRFKMRGEGLALQLKFESLPGEPFNIIGWSTWETANANI